MRPNGAWHHPRDKYLPDPGAPFGGVKASGIGRELGPDAIGAYQQFKSIYA